MKKFVIVVISLLVISVILSGCSKSGGSGSGSGKVTLTLYSTMNTDEAPKFKKVIADFEKEHPDIKINANFPGEDYEKLLRVKMAANEMPDLFDTHGWAIKRYGDYTADLSDMDWVKDMDEAMKPILTDDKGKVYAYPMNEAKDGLAYNKKLIEKYGITPPTTIDDFVKALETVKEKSNGKVTPLWIGGSEATAFGGIYDLMATPLLITDKDHDYSKQLLDGSFDWSHYDKLSELLKQIKDEGLVNKDALTAKGTQATQLMAQGKIAFAFISGSFGPETTALNKDVQVGLLPTPAFYPNQKPVYTGGERYTVAVWKDSKHQKEAKEFIDFISQPKYVKQIAELSSLPPGLTNVKVDNYYSDDYNKYSDSPIVPYFDRVYLPSGMWDVMGKTGQDLFSGAKTPAQVSKQMGDEYTRLRKQNQ
ncbi:raffinose/stachyose/melibiose transport system substrate-binding protein [Pullulanibacillus pueri]|uniref:Putative binding protein MsmE n=1 Tax=Pullulanibacillus pueri TaxID=1437324 RepID=A0A8J2ZRQ7_9BACL|nr:extracellular solute-binding protein [Pullulanibacillus pueri]MBM7679964.1 raffinose/stachyose/melibiose transport system substrate-binding protein [Pullulanibacillus pueri]GGH73700.1 putative binding protein MsmE [Pullulanibacillus pueri]